MRFSAILIQKISKCKPKSLTNLKKNRLSILMVSINAAQHRLIFPQTCHALRPYADHNNITFEHSIKPAYTCCFSWWTSDHA